MKNGSIIDEASMKQAGLAASVPDLSKMAYQAMNAVGADGKGAEDHCIERVNGMKDEYGTGAATLITIYNSLGLNLKLHNQHDVYGHFFKYSPDQDIYNGEWSCVLHVHPSGQAIGSHGMLCYGLVDSQKFYKEDIALVVAWADHYSGANQSACRFCRRDQYSASDAFYDQLIKGASASARTDYGVLGVTYGIGSETSPIFRVVVSQGTNL